MNKKRRIVIIVLASFALLALLLSLPLLRTESLSYSFLSGHTPMFDDTYNSNQGALHRVVYSFEADYDGICRDADSELIPRGYVNGSGGSPSNRHALRKSSSVLDQVDISISKDRIYNAELAIAEPNTMGFTEKPGWTSIKINHTKCKLNIPAYCMYLGRKLITSR